MNILKNVSVLTLSLIASNAFAQSSDSGDYPLLNDPFQIYFGGFYPQMTSKITINGDVVNPPPIGIEDTLGVEEGKFVPLGGFKWRISRRNSLELEIFQLNRDGFIDLFPDPVEVGDLIIESGSATTAFDISVARLTYGFSIMRSDRMDLQLKAGLHVADLSIGLQLSGAVCDVTLGQSPPGCPAGQTPPVESEEVTAPLPHFGASWRYALSPTIAAEIRAIGFAIELDNIDGSLLELSGDVIWKPWQNFGLGAGLRYFNVNVKGSGSNLNGEFDLEYVGPSIFVMASF